MKPDLSIEDIKLIIESLEYTRYKFENYQKFPSYEYKRKRMDEVSGVIGKMR